MRRCQCLNVCLDVSICQSGPLVFCGVIWCHMVFWCSGVLLFWVFWFVRIPSFCFGRRRRRWFPASHHTRVANRVGKEKGDHRRRHQRQWGEDGDGMDEPNKQIASRQLSPYHRHLASHPSHRSQRRHRVFHFIRPPPSELSTPHNECNRNQPLTLWRADIPSAVVSI